MAGSVLCPKCGGMMEEGFSPDVAHGAIWQTYWIPGKARKSFWTGTKVNWETKRPIVLYRCTQCDFIETYGRKEDRPTEVDKPEDGKRSQLSFLVLVGLIFLFVFIFLLPYIARYFLP